MSAFPANIVTVLKTNIEGIDCGPSVTPTVVARPLRHIDPNPSFGIVVIDWVPGAQEIGGREPTLSTYHLHLQVLVRHTDEAEARAFHGNLTKSLRTMLYRDEVLAVALRQLVEEVSGSTERLKRWGVEGQRFLANDIKGEFIFLSSTALWVETETV